MPLQIVSSGKILKHHNSTIRPVLRPEEFAKRRREADTITQTVALLSSILHMSFIPSPAISIPNSPCRSRIDSADGTKSPEHQFEFSKSGHSERTAGHCERTVGKADRLPGRCTAHSRPGLPRTSLAALADDRTDAAMLLHDSTWPNFALYRCAPSNHSPSHDAQISAAPYGTSTVHTVIVPHC